jgi:hypothetical protein
MFEEWAMLCSWDHVCPNVLGYPAREVLIHQKVLQQMVKR